MNANQYPKTVGPRAAFVVAELYERQKNVFSHADVEKIVALTDLARDEPRDLYDVWYLTAVEKKDLTALIPKVASKLEFRDKALAEMGDEFVKKEARLKKLWQVRLANQMVDLPHFDEVYRAVRRSLRVAGLMRG